MQLKMSAKIPSHQGLQKNWNRYKASIHKKHYYNEKIQDDWQHLNKIN